MDFSWHALADFFGYTGIGLLCLLGFALSCLSISGTWVILLAGGLLAWMRWPEYPGIITLSSLLVICIAVEIIEAFASSWGVTKRGGSKAAGWGALLGGFVGMFFGGWIPVPIIGSLIGMLIGSFGGAFWAEHARMKRVDHAAHVAFGAVIARITVIFIKAGITLGMMLLLVIGLLIHR